LLLAEHDIRHLSAECCRFLKDPLVFGVGKGHELAAKENISIEELNDIMMVQMVQNENMCNFVDSVL